MGRDGFRKYACKPRSGPCLWTLPFLEKSAAPEAFSLFGPRAAIGAKR